MVPREIEDNVYAKFWGTNKVHYGKMCKWVIKYTAAPFPQWGGGGGGAEGGTSPTGHTHIPTQILQNALCVVRSLAQANLLAVFTVSIGSVIDL